MSAAYAAAVRHLIGLSQAELAEMLQVDRHTVKDWESGRLTLNPKRVLDLAQLIAEHDEDVRVLGGMDPVVLPEGPKPRFWYVAVGARLLAQDASTDLRWATEQ